MLPTFSYRGYTFQFGRDNTRPILHLVLVHVAHTYGHFFHIHQHVMFFHHLAHHVFHKILVLIDPVFMFLHGHASLGFHGLHFFHGFLHHLHVLAHQFLALSTLGSFGFFQLLLGLDDALDHLPLGFIRRLHRRYGRETEPGDECGDNKLLKNLFFHHYCSLINIG